MKKFLFYFLLSFTGVLVIAGFVTATTYLQLVIASAFYPLLIYLVYKALPVRTLDVQIETPMVPVPQPVNINNPEVIDTTDTKEGNRITDVDKRGLLKLIGAAGLSFFLYSIFSKKAEVSFFRRLTGANQNPFVDSAGNQIDPARNQPTEGYQITEIDEVANSFYGFTDKNGAWFIMKEDVDTGSFRYARGDSEFPTNWTRRERLSYNYFHQVF